MKIVKNGKEYPKRNLGSILSDYEDIVGPEFANLASVGESVTGW
jgi:hypothetical protein